MEQTTFYNYIKTIEQNEFNVNTIFNPIDDELKIFISKGNYHASTSLNDLRFISMRTLEFEVDRLIKEIQHLEEMDQEPKEPETFNKEILVIQVGALLTKEKLEEVRQSIISQMSEGVVFIPPYMNAEILQVPENVDVRVESTLDTHEFLEKDFIIGGN